MFETCFFGQWEFLQNEIFDLDIAEAMVFDTLYSLGIHKSVTIEMDCLDPDIVPGVTFEDLSIHFA